MKTVKDILDIIADNNMEAFYLRVWGSKTIKNALDREALLYAVSFGCAYVIFKKVRGYLAYYIWKEYGGDQSECYYNRMIRCHSMSLSEALNFIRKIEDNGLGKTNYNESNIHINKIIDYIIVREI